MTQPVGYVRSKRLLCWVLSALLVLGVWVLHGLARWLVVADPLMPARALVVLGGHTPFRAMEAASLYREGWAPEV